MSFATQLSKNARDMLYGGNWTAVNLKDTLEDVDWVMATKTVYQLNSIAVLVNHIGYYFGVVSNVLLGKPLTGTDKDSFVLQPLHDENDWLQLQNRVFADADLFISLVEQMSEEKLFSDFIDPKYGNYYRNIAGIIEHTHYHLGQMVLIKKMLVS